MCMLIYDALLQQPPSGTICQQCKFRLLIYAHLTHRKLQMWVKYVLVYLFKIYSNFKVYVMLFVPTNVHVSRKLCCQLIVVEAYRCIIILCYYLTMFAICGS